MSRRKRGAARSLATGAKTHVRVTRQRRHMRNHHQQLSLDALYVPSDALQAFSVVCDPQIKSPAESITASSSCEKDLSAQSAELRDDASESTVSDDCDFEEQEEETSSEVARGGVTTTTFASQPFKRFEVTVEKRSERHFQIAARNLKTNEKWKSEPTQLYDFVNDENRIPGATLDEYIKCFKDALGGTHAAPVDFVLAFFDASDTVMRLEISLRVRVSSSQWLASYEFYLCRTKQKEDLESKPALVKLETRLQAQEIEIETLKQQVTKLLSTNEKSANTHAHKKNRSKKKKKYGVYFRATSVFAATRDKVIDWRTDRTSDAFHNAKDSVSSLVRFTRPGLFAVLVVMHHSNCEDESEAFQLLLNGDCVQSCFASNADGMRQTSSLVHFVHAKADDKLAVMYKGSGSTDESASFIEVNLMV